MLDVLPKRFGKYGLHLHPTKTRLIRFYPPSAPLNPQGVERRRQRIFDLLGLTHFWGRSMKGTWVVKRKTMKSRLQRVLYRISAWCKENRNLPVSQQAEAINQKLRGHYSYYGVTGKIRALELLYEGTKRIWHKWLGRRSNRPLLWERMAVVLKVLFPLRDRESSTRCACAQRIRDLTSRMPQLGKSRPWELWGSNPLWPPGKVVACSHRPGRQN